ncbi:MAG: hypothetical protein Q8M02_12860 [Candidatus Didemnitutus sp.]|nr:hypothetical protein [Candidatus Didemnitutus sp.]
MSVIKIHLDAAEINPVERLADALHVKPEDIAYAALNRLMLEARDPATQTEIIHLARAKSNNLPRWADSAGSVHAYEGMHDCEPTRSKYSL